MKSKKFVLAGLALLAITGLLALASCKNDTVPETPEAKQEQAGGTEGNNDSTNTEDNTSGGGDSGTGGEGSSDNPSAGNDGENAGSGGSGDGTNTGTGDSSGGTGGNAGTGDNNDSTNTEDNTSGGGDSGTVPPEAHTHTFDETEWKSDETSHWHPATCGHTEEKDGLANHTFGDWEVQTPSKDTVAGKLVKKCTTCSWTDEMEIPAGFVYIPAGTFKMGSTAGYDEEKPVHGVTISKGYFMGRHEVTQKEWAEVMKDNANGISKSPSNFKNSPAENEDQTQRPVESVSWYDAVVYCNRRSIAEDLTPCYAIDGETDPSKWGGDGTVPTSNDSKWNGVTCDWNANGYRLPTEAEWEYAARAGDATTEEKTWSGTDTQTKLKEYAWYNDSKTHEVGTKAANSLGLYDMSGNVWEWCWDWYDEKYYSSSSTESVTNPTGPTHGSSGDGRVRRGGSWDDLADSCAVSHRRYGDPINRYGILGFRLVRPSSK